MDPNTEDPFASASMFQDAFQVSSFGNAPFVENNTHTQPDLYSPDPTSQKHTFTTPTRNLHSQSFQTPKSNRIQSPPKISPSFSSQINSRSSRYLTSESSSKILQYHQFLQGSGKAKVDTEYFPLSLEEEEEEVDDYLRSSSKSKSIKQKVAKSRKKKISKAEEIIRSYHPSQLTTSYFENKINKFLTACYQYLETNASTISGFRQFSTQPSWIKGGVMRSYQLTGLNWLLRLYFARIPGAILADEMGLGKTLQSLSFCATCQHLSTDNKPSLFIVPLSTLSAWATEAKRWIPSLRVIVFHGSKKNRYELSRNHFNPSNPPEYDIVLTTPFTVQECSSLLSLRDWRLVVLDEAQCIKNEKAILSQKVRTFSADFRLLLTGTPIQNSLHELWALLNYLLPSIFHSAEQFNFIFDLSNKSQKDIEELTISLQKILSNFIIRRMKSDVERNIPDKTEICLFVGLSTMQRRLYVNTLAADPALIDLMGVEFQQSLTQPKLKNQTPQKGIQLEDLDSDSGSDIDYFLDNLDSSNSSSSQSTNNTSTPGTPIQSSNDDFDSQITQSDLDKLIIKRYRATLKNKNKISVKANHVTRGVRNLCMELRKICNHPYLIHGVEPNIGSYHKSMMALVQNSGKMVILEALLARLFKSNSRVLIFSQFVIMLNILEDFLEWKGYSCVRLDGCCDHASRIKSVEDFNAPGSTVFIFLLSTRSGGLGLNLTSANTVILFDSDWNPSSDTQAIDRAHRIGQRQEVKVYRLVTEHSFEEEMVKRVMTKKQLETLVIRNANFDQESSLHSGVDGFSMTKRINARPSLSETLTMAQSGLSHILSISDTVNLEQRDLDTILSKGKLETDRLSDSIKKRSLKLQDLSLKNTIDMYDFDGKDFKAVRDKLKKIHEEEKQKKIIAEAGSSNSSRKRTNRENFVQDNEFGTYHRYWLPRLRQDLREISLSKRRLRQDPKRTGMSPILQHGRKAIKLYLSSTNTSTEDFAEKLHVDFDVLDYFLDDTVEILSKSKGSSVKSGKDIVFFDIETDLESFDALTEPISSWLAQCIQTVEIFQIASKISPLLNKNLDPDLFSSFNYLLKPFVVSTLDDDDGEYPVVQGEDPIIQDESAIFNPDPKNIVPPFPKKFVKLLETFKTRWLPSDVIDKQGYFYLVTSGRIIPKILYDKILEKIVHVKANAILQRNQHDKQKNLFTTLASMNPMNHRINQMAKFYGYRFVMRESGIPFSLVNASRKKFLSGKIYNPKYYAFMTLMTGFLKKFSTFRKLGLWNLSYDFVSLRQVIRIMLETYPNPRVLIGDIRYNTEITLLPSLFIKYLTVPDDQILTEARNIHIAASQWIKKPLLILHPDFDSMPWPLILIHAKIYNLRYSLSIEGFAEKVGIEPEQVPLFHNFFESPIAQHQTMKRSIYRSFARKIIAFFKESFDTPNMALIPDEIPKDYVFSDKEFLQDADFVNSNVLLRNTIPRIPRVQTTSDYLVKLTTNLKAHHMPPQYLFVNNTLRLHFYHFIHNIHEKVYRSFSYKRFALYYLKLSMEDALLFESWMAGDHLSMRMSVLAAVFISLRSKDFGFKTTPKTICALIPPDMSILAEKPKIRYHSSKK